jgi:hypothetical protein
MKLGGQQILEIILIMRLGNQPLLLFPKTLEIRIKKTLMFLAL